MVVTANTAPRDSAPPQKSVRAVAAIADHTASSRAASDSASVAADSKPGASEAAPARRLAAWPAATTPQNSSPLSRAGTRFSHPCSSPMEPLLLAGTLNQGRYPPNPGKLELKRANESSFAPSVATQYPAAWAVRRLLPLDGHPHSARSSSFRASCSPGSDAAEARGLPPSASAASAMHRAAKARWKPSLEAAEKSWSCAAVPVV
mmetsp:Transcript_4956/g.21237  ORF Transcript_4956/g.21237 Transcript_4956/m.21237 type:complete len:205 (+) Transcript_4956:1748-2362(+)